MKAKCDNVQRVRSGTRCSFFVLVEVLSQQLSPLSVKRFKGQLEMHCDGRAMVTIFNLFSKGNKANYMLFCHRDGGSGGGLIALKHLLGRRARTHTHQYIGRNILILPLAHTFGL